MTHHYEDREPMSSIHCDADDRERAREQDRINAEVKRKEREEDKRKEREEDEAVREQLVHGARPITRDCASGMILSDTDLLQAIEHHAKVLGVPPTKLYATLKIRALQEEVEKLKWALGK